LATCPDRDARYVPRVVRCPVATKRLERLDQETHSVTGRASHIAYPNPVQERCTVDDELASRFAFDCQVVELMAQEESAGNDPYSVLRSMKLLGYGPEDVYRVAVFFESFVAGSKALVNGVEEYLRPGAVD